MTPDATTQPSITIVTHMNVSASAEQVWNSLVFYEGIEAPPPLYLQLLLPRPIRTQGSKSAVGDQATCLYQGGHLLKRVTKIEPNHLYEFTVTEQKLGIGGSIKLSGGCYSLRALDDGHTELSITTRYTSRNRPRWLMQPIEENVCHLFHRHLLGSIKAKAEAEATLTAAKQAAA